MKHTSLLGILLVLPATAFAQNFFPAKDLAFAQIAAGGGYETVLNVTNRGTSAYNGSLTLIPSDTTKPFNLLVNGNQLTGPLNLALAPDTTATLRITSGNESAGTVSGFATIRDADRDKTSLLEGNLTYYVKSADGTIVDSVGVAPSSEVFQAVVPFDDFFTVALALANQNAANQPATVKLTVFDDKNARVGAATQPLANNQQVPKFLYQYFPGVTLTKGRVEIQSDRLFIGTALTFVQGNQASSLPFIPSEKAYNFALSAGGHTFVGTVYVAINGPHVAAYGRTDTRDGVADPQSLDTGSGRLKKGNLELFFPGNDTNFDVLIPNYNPLQSTQSGSFVVYLVNPPGVAGLGTVTITAIN